MKHSLCLLAIVTITSSLLITTNAAAGMNIDGTYTISKKDKKKVNRGIRQNMAHLNKDMWCLHFRSPGGNIGNAYPRCNNIVNIKFKRGKLEINSSKQLALEEYCVKKIERKCK